jgi:hypothetical protein
MTELAFFSALMQLTDNTGVVLAENIPCVLDTVNIPLNMEVQGMVPTDWYDLYSDNWTLDKPARTNYFIDQATGTKYSIFGNPALYGDHLECRVTRYSGTTP